MAESAPLGPEAAFVGPEATSSGATDPTIAARDTASPSADASSREAQAASASLPRPSVLARGALALVHLYQRITANRPSPCRYVPTCSSYSLDAFEQHGFFRGCWLTARRISRCHPWGGHGWDPVPPRRDRHAHPAKGLQS